MLALASRRSRRAVPARPRARRALARLLVAGAIVAASPAGGALAVSLPALPVLPGASRPVAEGPGEETPRGAVREYLAHARRGDYEGAARYLDLSAVPAAERAAGGGRLARELQVVLDRTLTLDLDALADDPAGIGNDGLPANRDRLATVRGRDGAVDLLLARVPGPAGGEVWRIAASTVRRVPDLYAEYGYPLFVDRLPREFVDWRALGMDLWQWLGLAVLALAAWLLGFSAAWVLRRIALLLVRRTESDLDDRIADALHRPVRLMLTLYLLLASTYWLRLSMGAQAALVRTARGLTIALLTWVFLRVVDLLSRAAQERMAREERRGAVSMVNLGRRAGKVLIVALGVLGLLQNLGFNVTGVVAGLGIGGLAVALAAQKTLENVFGGVVLTVDRPIRVGDLCKFGDKVGTVEDVGLRSTRVRTLDRTVVSVPNAELAAIEIENFTVRDRFRIAAKLGVRCETTPQQMRRLVAAIREAFLAHPKVVRDPLVVSFAGFGPSALEIEVSAFVDTRDNEEFLAVREELYLRMMDLVAEAGTAFAFPSQTLYLGRDRAPGAPPARG
ncbi:MAG TPA: mechanosensitive ion channel family protein [bacterium]